MSYTITVDVNGKTRRLEVEARQLLVHLVRDTLRLTGTKIGCETGLCGSCTVIVDGLLVKSCNQLAVQADGCQVTTIEGLAGDGDFHSLQQSFWNEHGLQCGYCTPGMIMAAKGLLDSNPLPSESEIREGLKGNLCRCTGYHNIVRAVQAAAKGGE